MIARGRMDPEARQALWDLFIGLCEREAAEQAEREALAELAELAEQAETLDPRAWVP